MKKKKIEHKIKIKKTKPQKVYEALMDEKKHAKFTGAGAKINPEVGGEFSVYDDYATGKNIELKPGEKIVQSWRASDWPAEHYSTVTFLIEPYEDGEGVLMTFIQDDVPEESAEEIEQGWQDFYWLPLKEYLENEEEE
jgi:activator of HSP90 ATPase